MFGCCLGLIWLSRAVAQGVVWVGVCGVVLGVLTRCWCVGGWLVVGWRFVYCW